MKIERLFPENEHGGDFVELGFMIFPVSDV